MRKLIYSMTVSLDGYIASPDGAIDWSVPDEELFRFHTQQIRETGVHLCGRRLYETMVYWETAEESPPAADHVEFARIWKALPKVVFSATLERWWATPGWPGRVSARRSRGSRNSQERTSPSAAPASPVRV